MSAQPPAVIHVAAEPMLLASFPLPNPWRPDDRRYDTPKHSYVVQLCARCGYALVAGAYNRFPTGSLVEVWPNWHAVYLGTRQPTCTPIGDHR